MLAAVRLHVDAFVAALEDADLTVGNHRAPDEPPPYVVVYLTAGGEVDGTMSGSDDDSDLRIQTTSVGSGVEQALWVTDKVRAALDGATLTVADRAVQRVRLLTASSGVRRDEDVTPPVFYAVDVWGLRSFPA